MELREAQQAALIWLLVDLCMINCLEGSMIKKKKKKRSNAELEMEQRWKVMKTNVINNPKLLLLLCSVNKM